MKTFALALACAATLASAGEFRVGTRFVLDLDSQMFELTDSTGQVVARLVTDDMYYGLGLTAEYAPVRWLSFRAALAETRLLMQGGFAVALFPTLGGDVIVQVPEKWRVLPHVRFGGTWAGYAGIRDTLDGRMWYPSDYKLRFGFGVRYRLNDRINLVADTDIWGQETRFMLQPYTRGPWMFSAIGIDEAHLGATFLVPSR
jgi:hypothetical protein